LLVGSIMAGICIWWLWAVQKLSRVYHEKLEEKERESSM
jgi:hypothetical protein